MKKIQKIFLVTILFISLFAGCSLSEPSLNTMTILSGNLTSHLQLSDIGVYTHAVIDAALDNIVIAANLLAANLNSINATMATHAGLTSGVHGVTGAVVGTTDTQTLDNKTLTNTGNSTFAGLWLRAINTAHFLIGYTNTSPYAYFLSVANGGNLYLATPDSAGTTPTDRLTISGVTATAIATWNNVNQYFGSFFLQLTERAAPDAGTTNTARIYAVEGGDTLTDLCAVFQDGTVDIFAQEATPLDSPILMKSSGSIGNLIMVKPHPGLIQFSMRYSDGSTFVLKEIEYHDAEKIAANTGCLSSKLPTGWEVTTAMQRAEKARIEAERIKLEAEKRGK